MSTKHIIDNVMLNHLTCFLNKCEQAFKRDVHSETSSSFGLGIFSVTYDEFLDDYPLHNRVELDA